MGKDLEHSNNENYIARLKASEERLNELKNSTRRVRNSQELESLEQEIHGAVDAHAALLLERHIQESLDSPEQKEEEKKRKKSIHND